MNSNNEQQQQQISTNCRTIELNTIKYSTISENQARIAIYELKENEFPINKLSYNANLIYDKYKRQSELSMYAAIWYDILHHKHGASNLRIDIQDNIIIDNVSLPKFIVNLFSAECKAICCINQFINYDPSLEEMIEEKLTRDFQNTVIAMKQVDLQPTSTLALHLYHLCMVVQNEEDCTFLKDLWNRIKCQNTFENVSLEILFTSPNVHVAFPTFKTIRNFEIIEFHENKSGFDTLSCDAEKVRHGSKKAESANSESLAAQYMAHMYGSTLVAVESDFQNIEKTHFIVGVPTIIGITNVACNVFRFSTFNEMNDERLYTNMKNLKTKIEELSNQIKGGITIVNKKRQSYICTTRIIWIIFDDKQKWKELQTLHNEIIKNNANIHCKFIFTKSEKIWYPRNVVQSVQKLQINRELIHD